MTDERNIGNKQRGRKNDQHRRSDEHIVFGRMYKSIEDLHKVKIIGMQEPQDCYIYMGHKNRKGK